MDCILTKVLYSLHVLILFVAIFLCSVWARSMTIEQEAGSWDLACSRYISLSLSLCREQLRSMNRSRAPRSRRHPRHPKFPTRVELASSQLPLIRVQIRQRPMCYYYSQKDFLGYFPITKLIITLVLNPYSFIRELAVTFENRPYSVPNQIVQAQSNLCPKHWIVNPCYHSLF